MKNYSILFLFSVIFGFIALVLLIVRFYIHINIIYPIGFIFLQNLFIAMMVSRSVK